MVRVEGPRADQAVQSKPAPQLNASQESAILRVWRQRLEVRSLLGCDGAEGECNGHGEPRAPTVVFLHLAAVEAPTLVPVVYHHNAVLASRRPECVPAEEVVILFGCRLPPSRSNGAIPRGEIVPTDAAPDRPHVCNRQCHHRSPFGRPRFKTPRGVSQERDLQPAQATGGVFPSASHRWPQRSHQHRHSDHPTSARRVFPTPGIYNPVARSASPKA